jgi:hypothetical protein
MYSHLYNDTYPIPSRATSARADRVLEGEDVQTTAAGRLPRIRRRAGIAALGACVAAATVMTVGGASANPRPVGHGSHVPAQQLQRVGTLRAEGFVATSCTTGGTVMTDVSTNRSVLVSW